MPATADKVRVFMNTPRLGIPRQRRLSAPSRAWPAPTGRAGVQGELARQATKSPCNCSSSTWMRARRTVGSSISSSTCFWSRSKGSR